MRADADTLLVDKVAFDRGGGGVPKVRHRPCAVLRGVVAVFMQQLRHCILCVALFVLHDCVDVFCIDISGYYVGAKPVIVMSKWTW